VHGTFDDSYEGRKFGRIPVKAGRNDNQTRILTTNVISKMNDARRFLLERGSELKRRCKWKYQRLPAGIYLAWESLQVWMTNVGRLSLSGHGIENGLTENT
jgi:hypothetical protein